MKHLWADDIHDFWFRHIGPEHWFSANHEINEEISERFEPLWRSLRDEKAMFFLEDAREALAAIILFDQFPRNMFRGEPDSFSTDALALDIAGQAIELGYDVGMSDDERHFLYMPYMHSESLADQDRSVELFDGLGKHEALRHAILHREAIRQFGRFPHRNAILGRESLPEELQALAEGLSW